MRNVSEISMKAIGRADIRAHRQKKKPEDKIYNQKWRLIKRQAKKTGEGSSDFMKGSDEELAKGDLKGRRQIGKIKKT